MDFSQLLGPDGKYAMCFRSQKRPDLRTEINKFQPYGMYVNVDQERSWVFLRSYNLDDMQRCVEKLGDTYKFCPVKSNYKHRDFSAKNQGEVQCVAKQRNDASAKQKNDALHDTTDQMGLHVAVVMNLPKSFTTDRIRDMCSLVYVTPVGCEKRITRRGRPYCSVYFESRGIVKKMCSTLNGVKYDDKYIIVKDTSDMVS